MKIFKKKHRRQSNIKETHLSQIGNLFFYFDLCFNNQEHYKVKTKSGKVFS